MIEYEDAIKGKDGQEIKSKTQTGIITAPDTTLQIGCSWVGQSNYKGIIDEVRIYDYVDRDVPMLARMFEKRLRGYRAIGYSTEIAFAP